MGLVNMAEKYYFGIMNYKDLYQTPIYKSWANMKTRCNNKNIKGYHRYGGRGITYCKEWETFEGFYKEMGKSYQDGYQLDRINNDGNYDKNNCKWSNSLQQANNRHTNRKIEYKGKIQTLEEWVRELGLKSSTVRQRYYVYKMPIELCFNPNKIYNKNARSKN